MLPNSQKLSASIIPKLSYYKNTDLKSKNQPQKKKIYLHKLVQYLDMCLKY